MSTARRLGRSGVACTPRSTLAAWAGYAGSALEPLYDAHKRFVRGARVLHADETPVALLDPGAGKTRRGLRLGLCARRTRRAARRDLRVLTGPWRPVTGGVPRR
ncbi:IS66 family transposase [Variovorax robiniae]|uniref:IS66 family transposase n=1 Tax=Variovorax robiniae TaxID=1836199 RepID=UPI003BF618E5